jgi:hypothetical protein
MGEGGVMWLPFFLCRIFHRRYWKTTGGTMDAWDFDCPKCSATICLRSGDYPANRVHYMAKAYLPGRKGKEVK